MVNLVAYHNDPKLKESVLAEMARHRNADSLVQGHGYWSDGKGCAVGCLIKSGNHGEYETQFGIPRVLAVLEDRIFENLPVKEAQKWPEKFLGAIKPGVELGMVSSQLMYWLLTDPDGIRKHALPATLKIIEVLSSMYLKRINGQEPQRSEWLSISKEACENRYVGDGGGAAAFAATAAVVAADAYVGRVYVGSAYVAYVADVGGAAAYVYAYGATADVGGGGGDGARKKFFVRIADKLIELLGAA